MIDWTGEIRLFIDDDEYEFGDRWDFDFHPINYSSITFHDVIKKDRKDFPLNLVPEFIHREFSIAKVYVNNKLVYLGTLDASGRLSLKHERIKTRSIIITDFRKWLSLLKPIDTILFDVSPSELVARLITDLSEPLIAIGNLDFTTNEVISAYSFFNKTAYQILKEVIARQTNSILYFKIIDDKLTINYKSITTLTTPNATLDLNDAAYLEANKIEDIVYSNDTIDYANYIRIESDNIIDTIPIKNRFLKPWGQTIVLTKPVYTFIDQLESSYKIKNGIAAPLVIVKDEDKDDVDEYDLAFSQGSATLSLGPSILEDEEVTEIIISFRSINPLSIDILNQKEIDVVQSISQTNGIVYKYLKFNDLSSLDDLFKAGKTELELASNPKKTLTITCGKPIYDLMDVVRVSNTNGIDGLYIVHQVTGTVIASKNYAALITYTYTLKESRNTDTFINQFDNQSYRASPAISDNIVLEKNEAFNETIGLVFELESVEPSPLPSGGLLQFKLQSKLGGV